MAQFDVREFGEFSRKVVREGMDLVRAYQLGEKPIGEVRKKVADDSLLTVADRKCGAFLKERVIGVFPGIGYNIEDAGEAATQFDIVALGDPIDGTLPFTIGLMTSTVILGAYDVRKKRVLSCTIGEPATGRLWHSQVGGACGVWACRHAGRRFCRARATTVWSGKLSTDSVVLLDASRGFRRSGRQIFYDEQAGQLVMKLAQHRLLMAGSNGLHQALVANGNDRMAGVITTAIGGPWDVCGVLLVFNAGGAARAFRVTEDRQLEERDPLDVMDYDVLVVGNCRNTVDSLSGVLHRLF